MTLIKDEWLSKIMGTPAYSVQFPLEDLPPAPGFITAKLPFKNTSLLTVLLLEHFSLMDVNVTLLREPGELSGSESNIRFATESDKPAIQKISAENLIKSRFSYDPDITNEISSKIKAEWAGNFFNGARGDYMIVADNNGEVAGFLLLIKKGAELIIDLIAVDKAQQGKGYAKAMIAFAFSECGLETPAIKVGTSYLNTQSLGLYAQLGFKKHSLNYLLHKHI